MSKTALRRDTQLQALVDIAERKIASGGLGGLKARDLAAELDCAVGAIYNLVADMDDLILRVRARTLDRLDALVALELSDAPYATTAQADAEMVAIALAYCRFARANTHLWRTLFEHRVAGPRVMPDTAREQQTRIFKHIAQPLRAKMPDAADADVFLLGRTLFAAVHGVVVISMEETLLDVPQAALETQVEKMIRIVCRGLDAP